MLIVVEAHQPDAKYFILAHGASAPEIERLFDIQAGAAFRVLTVTEHPRTRAVDQPPRPSVDRLDFDLAKAFIRSLPQMRHTIVDVIHNQIPGGLPSWVDGHTNSRYNVAASIVRRARRAIEQERRTKFVRVDGGERSEVMLAA